MGQIDTNWIYVLVQVYLYFRSTSQSPHVEQAMYTLSHVCNVSAEPSHVTSTPGGSTRCGALCLYTGNCMAFDYSDLDGCRLYQRDLTFNLNCTADEANVTSLYVSVDDVPPLLFPGNHTSQPDPTATTPSQLATSPTEQNPCQNGGVYDSNLMKCNCTPGWLSDNCSVAAQGCKALSEAGYRTNGNYTVHPSASPHPFQVYCTLSAGHGLTTIQERFRSNSNFNRSWQEYKDGFQNGVWEDFWLGNEKIYYLTQSTDLTLVLQLTNASATTYQRYYDKFVMADESSDYAVTYATSWNANSPTTQPMADCWPETSLSFSTFDNDNDNDPLVNCAALHGAGWWFESSNNCTLCNINGVFPGGSPYTGDPSEAFISVVEPDFSPTYMTLYLWQSG